MEPKWLKFLLSLLSRTKYGKIARHGITAISLPQHPQPDNSPYSKGHAASLSIQVKGM